jgi:AcrR family transcriptional regulator
MSSTKQKIIEGAISLFNEQGIANVRLQQIADAAGISTGNLAYHFNTKETLVQVVYQQVSEELTQSLRLYSVYPNLLDFDLQLSRLFQTFRNYPFFLLDLAEIQRFYPSIQKDTEQFFAKLTIQLEKRIEFNQQRSIIQPATPAHPYRRLAEAMVLTITFWSTQQRLMNREWDNEPAFKQAVWLHLTPFLTGKGQQEFQNLIYPLLQN